MNPLTVDKRLVTVVGLGPAGPEYLTVETAALLEGDAPVWLRTSRHPAATGIEAAGSFDSLYETSASFEEVYSRIVSELIELTDRVGEVVYAVPGSPMVAERTVELLRRDEAVVAGTVELNIRPAMAFTDLCWRALGVDPMAEAATTIDALSLAIDGAGRVGPLLITQVHSSEVLDEIIGVLDDVAPDSVAVLQGLGTADERIVWTPWSQLRQSVDPDHLTSLWIPRLAQPLASAVVRLDETVRRLRIDSPDVAQQSFDSLRASLPDASAAVVDSIYGILDGDDDASFDLEQGLAEVLLLLVLHARLAAEAGWFTIEDVANTANSFGSLGGGPAGS